MKVLGLLGLVLLVASPYIYNGYKLAGCDFESSYKCEVIHGIGVVIPPAAFVTAWFDDDRK